MKRVFSLFFCLLVSNIYIAEAGFINIALKGKQKVFSINQSSDSLSQTVGLKDFYELKKNFKDTVKGKAIKLFILKNKNNAQVAITNHGARLVGLLIPDKNNSLTDVILGLKSSKEYLAPRAAYFGPIVGRFANRINKGVFTIDGQVYKSSINNAPNTLHGGKKGFHSKVWDAEQVDHQTLVLKYLSVDGEEGYPGNLNVTLTYSLNDKNELKMEYEAYTDKKTIINLTNHSYFNLNGEGSGTVLNHLLKINADRYTPINEHSIPDGSLPKVNDTPFDFKVARTIGSKIDENDQQLKNGKGYDHNFVVRQKKKKKLNHVAMLQGDRSGIVMNVYSTEPGVQLYSGNFFNGKNQLKGGGYDTFRSAVALETQHFPDAPNQPNFPSTILNPGQKFHSISIYQFSLIK